MSKVSGQRRVSRRRAELQSKEVTSTSWSQTWLNESLALFCLTLAVFILASFLSEALQWRWSSSVAQPLAPRANLMGPLGHVVGLLLLGGMGWCALAPVVCLAVAALYLWRLDARKKPIKFTFSTPVGILVIFVSASLCGALFFGANGGGSIGVTLAEPLRVYLNTSGAALLALMGIVLGISLSAQMRVFKVVGQWVTGTLMIIGALFSIPIVMWRGITFLFRMLSTAFSGGMHNDLVHEEHLPRPRRRRNTLSDLGDDMTLPLQEPQEVLPPEEESYSHVVVKRRLAEPSGRARDLAKRLKEARSEPLTSEPSFANYELPPLSLLTKGEVGGAGEDDAELREKSRQIEGKLKDFGILGRVTHVHPGPVITLFEFEPAAGVKVGRIAALQDDLAMTLRATSIRIIAPIPRRGTVGIEVPNRHRDIVRLRDVLECEAFVSAESILSVGVGKDTYGDPVVVDIASMPHLLMAGATGTGKSVCINAVLLSLLYRSTPAELGLILIDPKVLELSVYEDIPHLRVPVVTHPRQAKAVLLWAINEMERRYQMMRHFSVRSIDGYNRLAKGEQDGEPEREAPLNDQVVLLTDDAVVEEGTIDTEAEDGLSAGRPPISQELKPLPKIVIVIDELADLMLSVGKEVEELVTRLAQKARAAGIHLIVATQRPSVDVITGLIKANFPARLSFRVSSRIDSRTILDSMGAEKLLGRGDLLFMQPGAEALRRIHGAFVSDGEVKRVVTYVKQRCNPHYDEHIMRICAQALEEERKTALGEGDESTPAEDAYDEFYDRAVELVTQRGHASTSMIQRAFRIGYNRAARIIEMMERDGVVGPMDGVKPREVLAPRAEG